MVEVQKQLELEAECNAKRRASRPASRLTTVVKLEKEGREHEEHRRALRAEEEGDETMESAAITAVVLRQDQTQDCCACEDQSHLQQQVKDR
ncbi:hypothetical protein ACFX2J_014574 [Malus domestica]